MDWNGIIICGRAAVEGKASPSHRKFPVLESEYEHTPSNTYYTAMYYVQNSIYGLAWVHVTANQHSLFLWAWSHPGRLRPCSRCPGAQRMCLKMMYFNPRDSALYLYHQNTNWGKISETFYAAVLASLHEPCPDVGRCFVTACQWKEGIQQDTGIQDRMELRKRFWEVVSEVGEKKNAFSEASSIKM